MKATKEAIGCLELASVPRGIGCLDQMVKRAVLDVVAARTVSPGRYLIVTSGGVAELEEAEAAALAHAGPHLVDHVLLRDPAVDLRDGLDGRVRHALGESLLIVETTTLSSAFLSAELALKGAEVGLLELRLGAGLSGKGIFTLTGPLHMIQAGADAIASGVDPTKLVTIETIAQPHPELPRSLLGAEGLIVRGRGGDP